MVKSLSRCDLEGHLGQIAGVWSPQAGDPAAAAVEWTELFVSYIHRGGYRGVYLPGPTDAKYLPVLYLPTT